MITSPSRPLALTFLGGAGTVTGSKYLVDAGDHDVLVDAGLFQGVRALRRRNWQRPPLDLHRLAAVVVTHAHLDHCGWLPVLVREGWRGPILLTPGTAALAAIVLADSAHLMVEEAALANAGGWSKHRPALPLYDERDAERAISLFRPVDFDTPVGVAGPGGRPRLRLRFGRAGHILGSAWAQLSDLDGDADGGLVVSGDLGRPTHLVLNPPQPRPPSATLLLESTYGSRERLDDGSARQALAAAVRRTARRGGSVLIPAFAVDRTEVVLLELARLMREEQIPRLPVFVDSPMALAALRVYRKAVSERSPEIRPELFGKHNPFDPGALRELRTAEESSRVNDPLMPCIVVSASGMATGGRVLHHLRHMLPEPKHTVLVVGFAAPGTRAAQLVEGAHTVKIHGQYVRVRADVVSIDAFSAHADASELVGWAVAAEQPRTTYLVHGEPDSARTLADRLTREHGWAAVVPADGERVLLSAAVAP
jgi:metallo-beta-lactamase family protein